MTIIPTSFMFLHSYESLTGRTTSICFKVISRWFIKRIHKISMLNKPVSDSAEQLKKAVAEYVNKTHTSEKEFI